MLSFFRCGGDSQQKGFIFDPKNNSNNSNNSNINTHDPKHWSVNRMEDEASMRRLQSNLHVNLISEDYSHSIRQFYAFERAPVLGTGGSGCVRLCEHKQT